MRSFSDFMRQRMDEEGLGHEESHYDASERREKSCDRLTDAYLRAEDDNNQAEMQRLKKQVHDEGQECVHSLESKIRNKRFKKKHPNKSLFSKEAESDPVFQDDYDVYKKD